MNSVKAANVVDKCCAMFSGVMQCYALALPKSILQNRMLRLPCYPLSSVHTAAAYRISAYLLLAIRAEMLLSGRSVSPVLRGLQCLLPAPAAGRSLSALRPDGAAPPTPQSPQMMDAALRRRPRAAPRCPRLDRTGRDRSASLPGTDRTLRIERH